MRQENGPDEPDKLVRAFAAFRGAYFVFSRFALALLAVVLCWSSPANALIYEVPPTYWETDLGYPLPQGATFDAAVEATCQQWFGGLLYGIARTRVDTLYDGIQRACFATQQQPGFDIRERQSVYFRPTPVCEVGTTFTYPGVPYEQGKCRKVECPTASRSCFIKSTTGALSVPQASCTNGCLFNNSLGAAQERYEGGQIVYWYPLSVVGSGGGCNTSSYAAASCTDSTPPPQDPCLIPGAATSAACGGGTGCPAGTTALANGACTANDSNAPCLPPNARNAQNVCVPYLADSGSGGGGTAGGSGSSGSSGGAGAAGSAGSGTTGGTGGGGGGGGSGGTGGAGGAGGAAKDDVKCGATGDLCQTKFQEYYDTVKEFFAADTTMAAAGKAELLKASTGGYEDNKLNKGTVVSLDSLNLETGGGMISGGRACPAPKQIGFKGQSFAISFQPLCDFGGYIRFMLLAVCGIVCARIVLGAWT